MKTSNEYKMYFIIVCVALFQVLSAFQPEFAEPIVNISVAVGRDATFTCHVRHLGGYRVGWLKADTKAIQAIHEHVITHNPRVSVTHSDQFTWNLHIKSVTEEDRGGYMCQLNTDPMKSQIGYLDVVIPPDFVAEDTSSDVIVPEGATVKLTCRARGYPEPIVTWRREDGSDIILKDSLGTKNLVPVYKGEVLKLSKISRGEMGSYLCIASNGVPPSVSKRISLSIHFHPVIQVPNQLVGAPLGTDVQIECHVEASPKSINYWVKDTGEMIVSSPKYHVQESSKSMYETKMTVIVRKFQKEDVGSYRCIAKNSLGEVDSSIRIYEIPGPSRKILPPKYGTETNDILKQQNKHQLKVTYQPSADDEDLYASSAEEFDENDMSNILYHQQKSTNKPSSTIFDIINSNSNSKHNHNHHHHHHQNNGNNGGINGNTGTSSGGSGVIGGNSDLINGLVTRKPPFYIPEIRGDVNNELSHLGSNSISNIKNTTMSIIKSIVLVIGVVSSISSWLWS